METNILHFVFAVILLCATILSEPFFSTEIFLKLLAHLFVYVTSVLDQEKLLSTEFSNSFGNIENSKWRKQNKKIRTQQSFSPSVSTGDLWQCFMFIFECSCPWRCLSKKSCKVSVFATLWMWRERSLFSRPMLECVLCWLCWRPLTGGSRVQALQEPVQIAKTPAGNRNEIWLTQPKCCK